MKKHILFICSNLNIGGFQKSLISCLQCMDYDRYDIDLLLLDPDGVFLNLVPSKVRILPQIMPREYFMSAKDALSGLFKRRRFGLFCYRALCAAASVINKGLGAVMLSRAMPPLKERYDAAIDYNGQYLLYYLIDKVNADRKITFFHSDYKKWPYYEKADRKYYAKADAIVTVSKVCVSSMRDMFPEYADKIHLIENIISQRTVNRYPKVNDPFADGFGGVRLLTVARACSDKGTDLAACALSVLKERGANVRWYWVGPVTELGGYNKLIEEKEIGDDFIFLGPSADPYGYMRECDIIVQPSRIEGKSVAIEEAKVIGKPVVTTDFSTVEDQIEDGVTGIVTKMDGESIANGIERLLSDRALYDAVCENLKKFARGNEEEADKLSALIDGN